MAKGAAAGSAFLTGVLAKLTGEDRQKGEEALKTLQTIGGGAIITAVGDGTLAQDEFSRQADQLREHADELAATKADLESREAGLTGWYQQLTDWHAENKDLISEAKRLKASGGAGTPGVTISKIPEGMLTYTQLNERITAERAGFLGFQVDANKITREHQQKFGEIPDLESLIRHPQIATLGLTGVYQLTHKDRLEKHSLDAAKAAEDKIRLDERQKVLAETASMPYPSPTGAGSGSPLDGLTAKVEPLVDAATAHYNRLQHERQSTGSPG